MLDLALYLRYCAFREHTWAWRVVYGSWHKPYIESRCALCHTYGKPIPYLFPDLSPVSDAFRELGVAFDDVMDAINQVFA